MHFQGFFFTLLRVISIKSELDFESADLAKDKLKEYTNLSNDIKNAIEKSKNDFDDIKSKYDTQKGKKESLENAHKEVGIIRADFVGQIKTWDDYYEAAEKLKEIGAYIVADSGDGSFYDAMVWLAGGQPFHTSADGKTVTIDLDEDAGTQRFTEFWPS